MPKTVRKRLIENYLFAEAGRAWLAVTAVLLAIMLSTRFARFLGEAARGHIPQDLLLKVVLLSSLQYLTILIPVSLMLGAMLALGRMYRDSEITAMHACGVGLTRLYGPFLRLSLWLAVLTGLLSFYLSPLAGRTVDFLTKRAAQELKFSSFEPGVFRNLPGDAGVLYVAEVRDNGRELRDVFIRLAGRDTAPPSVITARRGVQRVDPDSGERSVVLLDGHRVDGVPGLADYRLVQFGQHGVTLQAPAFVHRIGKQALKPTAALWGSPDPRDIAELQWRWSSPISVVLLVLLAVPLARTDARAGRFNQIGLGILIYIVYFNLLGVAQAWLESGALPPWIGLWWVHLIMALFALRLYAVRGGYLRRILHRLA